MSKDYLSGVIGKALSDSFKRSDYLKRCRDAGIPALDVERNCGYTFYRIMLPNGKYLRERRNSPTGHWWDVYAPTRKRGALRRLELLRTALEEGPEAYAYMVRKLEQRSETSHPATTEDTDALLPVEDEENLG